MYLCKNKYKKVFPTDISDIIVTKTPFDFIVTKSNLYVGEIVLFVNSILNY